MILTSTFDDTSYVRQKLVYDLWKAMAEFQNEHRLTPATFFAVVYINGVYQGLYVAVSDLPPILSLYLTLFYAILTPFYSSFTQFYSAFTQCDRIDDEFIRHHDLPSGEGNMYKAVNHDANFYLTREA